MDSEKRVMSDDAVQVRLARRREQVVADQHSEARECAVWRHQDRRPRGRLQRLGKIRGEDGSEEGREINVRERSLQHVHGRGECVCDEVDDSIIVIDLDWTDIRMQIRLWGKMRDWLSEDAPSSITPAPANLIALAWLALFWSTSTANT